MTRPSPGARQHETHRQLLARTSARFGAGSLHAIIVPASRPAVNLDHAVTLARALRCQLVVLCSLNARAAEVNELLASRNYTRTIVVDLPEGYTHPMLDFVTSKLAGLDLPDICVNPNADLSTKRNLGLLLARMLGWERIFFLDDDIRDLDSSGLHEVASMLGPYRAVGMRSVNFPDNSVVCHGHRQTGGYQDVFVSGSVLGVNCAELVPFFPEIYNEDWFFFYHAAAARKLGWSGRNATQLCYDPFADPRRAEGQEFGDVMAEGLYSLLHYRRGAEYATTDYWQLFLDSRIRFLDAVLARSEMVEPYLRKRIATSIKTAMACTRQIKPSMCESYLELWKQDLAIWRQRLKEARVLSSANAALRELSLIPSRRSPHELAGIIGGGKGGVSKDVTAGITVPIPSSLDPSAAEVVRKLGAPQATDIVSNSDCALPLALSVTPAGRESDGLAKGFIDHMTRYAGQFVLRAVLVLAKDPSKPIAANRIRDVGRPTVGKHRKAPELVTVSLSSRAEESGAGQETVLA